MMATLALAAIGTSLGGAGSFLATAGAFLGGILDNSFVFPAIFGRPDVGTIEGPRLSSLAPQEAAEGAALSYCLGSRVRVGGALIWMTELEEVVSTSGGGGGKGGGGGGGGSRTYAYFASAMIAICEGEIDGIVKAYADGKVFIKEASPGTMDATTEVTVTDDFEFVAGLPYSYYGPNQIYKTGGGGTYFSDLGFDGSGELEVSGFSNPGNNNTREIKNKRVRTTDGNESLTLRSDGTNTAVTESGTGVTLTQTINRYPANVDRVTLYPGAASDAIDSLVEADLGVGSTPRFKKVAKMTIERLALADYGNRLPTFNFVVNRQDPTTVREAITDIMTRGGFSGGDFDVTGIDNSYELQGYAISGAKSIAATLEPIMLVWNLGVYEDNGVLTFYERGNETTLSDVRTKDWTARRHGSAPEDIARIEETPTFDLPSEVSISYPDANNKDEIGEARARRIDFVSDIKEGIRIPIRMSAGLARSVAENRLWRAWNDKRTATFNLPPRFLQVTEGDIVPIEIGGETYNVRLTRVSRGADYILSCEGIVQDNSDFDFSQDGEDVSDVDDDPAQPSDLLLFIFNAPPLDDDHVSTPGYYWAFALENYDSNFSGGSLYESPTEAGTYSIVSNSPEATIIATEDQLGSVANPRIFDETNTLDVDVIHGTLSSVNEIDLLNGANRIVMSNGEIIGFQTATSIGTNRYRLSKLLRGLRGTERFIGTHGADGEIGVLLDSATVQFTSHNLAEIDQMRSFKAVATGQAIEDITAESFTYAGCTVKPFPVANIEATRNGSNDVTLTWDRRTRSVYPELVATIPPPLVDGVEKYEVDLYDPSGTTVESTYTDLTSPTATINDADIVAAGYSSGDPITVKVYQISPSVGRGVEKEATV